MSTEGQTVSRGRGRNVRLRWVGSEKKGLMFVTGAGKEEKMCPGNSEFLPIKNTELFCSCEM